MENVTSTAEEVVDVWPYIEQVLATDFAELDTDDWNVDYVYINAAGTYQHLLVDTCVENVHLVVVVDMSSKTIYGHHLLNLNQKYGLGN